MEKISHHHHADAASPDLAEMSPSRKLRTERRRNQILDAADAVFQTHGFHAASMAKVAAEEQMSLVDLSYAWVAQRRGVDSVLLGPGDVTQLDAGIDGVGKTVSPGGRKALDELHVAFSGTDARYAR